MFHRVLALRVLLAFVLLDLALVPLLLIYPNNDVIEGVALFLNLPGWLAYALFGAIYVACLGLIGGHSPPLNEKYLTQIVAVLVGAVSALVWAALVGMLFRRKDKPGEPPIL